MFVSVIVPVFNVAPDLLTECLRSIKNQTLRPQDYEIIIVDDCSSNPDTIRTIDELSKNFCNSRIIHHKTNLGLNAARRTGVSVAKGEYVVFVDGDDILTRYALEYLKMNSGNGQADLVTAPMWRWDSAHKRYVNLKHMLRPFPSGYLDRINALLARQYSFTMCGRLLKRSLLDDQVFDLPPGHYHEDVATFPRFMFKVGNCAHVDHALYYYTVNEGSITYKRAAPHIRDLVDSVSKWRDEAEARGLLPEVGPTIATGGKELIGAIAKEWLSSDIPGAKTESAPIAARPDSKGLEPSEYARRLKDKIVFVCDVDYQLRNAAAYARELRLRGHPCAVLDLSSFASRGLRQLPKDEISIFRSARVEHIRIEDLPLGVDFFSTAKLVVLFNDWSDYLREALEYRHRLSLPSVCMVEGISDFLRCDFDEPRALPYRRCDYVFLAGEDDEKFFGDRKTFVIGLPIVEKLASTAPQFPDPPLAVLNVNFTFGSLEAARGPFVHAAMKAFNEVGIDWVVTQHPMDGSDLSAFPVSSKTQYELIDESTVFVSRFATGIIEALASGKPAIYFNPHGEKVEKFTKPLGAFPIATNAEELAGAIRSILIDVQAGVDFRARAAAFLKRHAAYRFDERPTTERFADAAVAITESFGAERAAGSQLFFDRLAREQPFGDEIDSQIFGDFGREHRAQLLEEQLIGRYFLEALNKTANATRLMVDVGANHGNSLDIFLGMGWTVHAFEPDPSNRARLLASWPTCPKLIVNEEAVSDQTGLKLPFYASEESTGISSLDNFTPGHRKICDVETVTLRDYLARNDVRHVDFLKIDVEGYDKFVLDGFPWNADKPDVVLAEFEDNKTNRLGYDVHDVADVLLGQGYTVYASEWLPIVRYGIAHDWRRIFRYTPDVDLSETWGSLIGFRDEPDENVLRRLVKDSVKFGAGSFKSSHRAGATVSGSADGETDLPVSPANGTYVAIAERLKRRSTALYLAGRFAVRSARTVWRRRFGAGGLAIAAIVLPLVIALLAPGGRLVWPMIALSGLGAAALFVALVLSALRGHLRQRDEDARRRHNAILARIEGTNRRTGRLAEELSEVRAQTQRLYWLDQMRSKAQCQEPRMPSLDLGISKETIPEHERPG
ncbi:FkbM family methyltransferase [Methyloceanibacter sp.]|uniref:FkbM family methyltransferase n=1 Tax=Methyloceanibacter sp. TaxID=1965321 RepID=UPI002BE4CA6A|nr:FkbM family methyltransferase [Methyloceanibacter sp.]HML91673.1 FkbM family methyltransferase [Methyloceanibacter sp.]